MPVKEAPTLQAPADGKCLWLMEVLGLDKSEMGQALDKCKCRLKNVQKSPVVYSQAFAPVIVSSFRRGAVHPTN